MKNILLYINIIFFSLIGNLLFAQITEHDNTVGKNYIIKSGVLGNDRHIQVFLPEGKLENKKLDVIYVLDGQKWFLYTVSLVNLFVSYDFIPPCMVVGINTENKERGNLYWDAQKTLDYIEKDIISFIDKKHNISDKRLLFGWQYAAAFTIESLAIKPNLFKGFIAASPYPLTSDRIKSVENHLENNSESINSLFIGTSLNEGSVQDGVDELEPVLKEKATTSLNWQTKVLDLETKTTFGHRTTPLETLYQGLRNHYYDYTILEFTTIDEFQKSGGLENLKNYYLERGKKYSLEDKIPDDGMFSLIRTCIKEEDINSFSFLITEFNKMGFLNNLSSGWGTRMAEFYLKHKKNEEALKTFEFLNKKFPDNARIINGLGNAFKEKGQIKKAKKQYSLAIEIAKKNDDSNLNLYKENLNKLK